MAAVFWRAGGGTRFEGSEHKLLAGSGAGPSSGGPCRPRPGAALDEVAVIVGAVDLGAAVPEGVHVIQNPEWASGQAFFLAGRGGVGPRPPTRRHGGGIGGSAPGAVVGLGGGGGLSEPHRGGDVRWSAPTSGPA